MPKSLFLVAATGQGEWNVIQGRLSGPLLDRLDLQVEVPALPARELAGEADGESSAVVAARVAQAQARQRARQGELNVSMSLAALERHARLDGAGSAFLQAAAARLGWSARSYHRVLRVARTVADLDAREAIGVADLAEAIQLRRVLNAP